MCTVKKVNDIFFTGINGKNQLTYIIYRDD